MKSFLYICNANKTKLLMKMNLNLFKKIIDTISLYNNIIDELEKYGIQIIDSKMSNGLHDLVHEILINTYDEDGVELIYWWLYEDVDKFLYDSETHKKIEDLTTVENLFAYLNGNHLLEDNM